VPAYGSGIGSAPVVTQGTRGSRRDHAARNHHNLQRQDHRGFAGWVVRIWRRGRLVGYGYFSDLQHGGRRRALAKALAYRDDLLRALPPPALAKTTWSRNTTGVVGLSVQNKLGAGGARLRYYVASWVWPPRSRYQVRKTFSAQKYGERRARALAVEARLAGLARAAEAEKRRILAVLSRRRR
jgi:hypothetical protein